MAYELAKAYVQIIPTTKGMVGAISRELNGNKMGAVSQKSGINIGGKITSGLGQALKVGAGATVAAAGAALGTVFYKGFNRLSAFEAANKSLEGMKLTAGEIKQVMDNANTAVKGTAYGLDEAATMAASLLRSGIKPGHELQRILGLVGDTASQTGSSFSEMGMIWQKVLTKGKLQGDEAMQLMERGVPIFQMVADELGITAEEAQKLASESKISFETFATVMEKNFAGSALKMGETVAGSWANLGAAAGRLGQTILGGLFEKLPGAFTTLQGKVDAVNSTIKPFITDFYRGVDGIAKTFKTGLADVDLVRVFGVKDTPKVLVAIQSVKDAFGRLAAPFELLKTQVAGLFEPITKMQIVDALSVAGVHIAQFAGFLMQLAQPLITIVGSAKQVAGVFVGALFNAASHLVAPLERLAVTVADGAAALSGAMIPAAEALAAALTPVASAVGAVIDVVASLPAPVVAGVLAFAGIAKAASALKPVFTQVQAAVDTFRVRLALANMSGFSGAAGVAAVALGGLKATVIGVGNAIKAAFISNPIGLTITALTTVISLFASASAEAKQRQEGLRQSLDQTTGAVTQQTAAWLQNDKDIQKLAATYEAIGGSATELYAAIMGGGDALDSVKAKTEAYTSEHKFASRGIVNLYSEVQRESLEVERQGDAVRETAEATREATGANDENAASLDRLKNAQEALLNQQKAASDAQFAARDAAQRYAEEQQNLADALADIEIALNDKEDALFDVTKAGLDSIQADREIGASSDELKSKMQGLRDQFIDTYIELGHSREEAEAYADQLMLIPDSALTQAKLETGNALQELDGFIFSVNTAEGTVTINGTDVPATQTLGELIGNVNEADGTVTINGNKYPADVTLTDLLANVDTSNGTITIGGEDYPAHGVLATLLGYVEDQNPDIKVGAKDAGAMSTARGLQSEINSMWATIKVASSRASGGRGHQVAWANGGMLERVGSHMVQTFANGSENHVAQIAPAGAYRVWAEEETGGEAYIPLAASKRARSEHILAQVADRFGMELTRKGGKKYADGGYFRLNDTDSPIGGQTVNITVNIRPEDLAGIRTVEDFVVSMRRQAVMQGVGF